jgi:glycerol-3-phosphate O-acyltransferase
VAYSLMEALRRKYPELDLYRFLRLSSAQRTLPYSEFLATAEAQHKRVKDLASKGELHLSEELETWNLERWVGDGIAQLGLLHDAAVAKRDDATIWTEDMNLLYYYRNRLTGYGVRKPGQHDSKGFLA